MIRITLMTVCTVVLGATFMGSIPVQSATLETELAGLLLDHPQIRAASKTLEAQRKEIDIANAGFLPAISTTSEAGHEFVDSPGTRNI